MMSGWAHLVPLELLVVGLAVVVLLADAFLSLTARALGGLVVSGLVGILAASFVRTIEGVAPHGVYVASAWGLYFERLFLVAGVLGVLGAMDWLAERTPRRAAEYYAVLLFSLCGMMLIPGARDWLVLVVAFELMGIPMSILAAWAKTDGPVGEEKAGPEAALKLFVTSVASSAFTLFGLGLVVGGTGSTALSALPAGPLAPLTAVGMLMVVGGLSFKVGAVPFHMWVPDTYQGAPTPFVAFLSAVPKAGGLAALMVVLLSGWAGQQPLWGPALGAIAGLSMLVGNVFAVPQTDVRRLLGFSGVSQMGYVLVAVCAGTEEGVTMALFFLATYLFTSLGAFLVVHAAASASGGHELKLLAGLSRRTPWLGAALLVFLLSLAGIPFVVGFWAKLFVFMAAWKAGLVALVALGATVAVLGLFYYLSVARSTFMAEGSTPEPVRGGRALMAAIALCLVAVVGLGLWPRPLVEYSSRAASALLKAR